MTFITPPTSFPRQEFLDWVRVNLGEARYQEFQEINVTFGKLLNRAINDGAAIKIDDKVHWDSIEIMQEYLDNQWPEELRRQKYYWAQTKRDWLAKNKV